MDKIEIDLGNGVSLCAESGESTGYNEFYVYIKKDGVVWQDLAIIGEQWCYDMVRCHGRLTSTKVRQRGEYYVKVYANELSEDYTDEFTIKQYEEEE